MTKPTDPSDSKTTPTEAHEDRGSELGGAAGSASSRCATCKWWQLSDESRYSQVIFPYDPVTYEQEEDEEKNAAKWGHKVRRCKHPKVVFYERPARDGAAVCDGSQYHAELLTAEDFGCVLHEPNTKFRDGATKREYFESTNGADEGRAGDGGKQQSQP